MPTLGWSPYLLWMVPVLLLLVGAHELGHFTTAKLFGVRVKEFAIGFPPRIASIARGGTEYSINLFPIGGYVRLEGEDGDSTAPDSFAVKPKRQRAIILAAGAAMNLLMAPVLMTCVALVGQPTIAGVTLQAVQADSPAAAAGLAPGDVIISIDGQRITDDHVLQDELLARGSRPVQLVVWPGGNERQARTLDVTPRAAPAPNQGRLGITFSPRVVMVQYPLLQAPARGIGQSFDMLGQIADGFRQLFFGPQPVLDQVGGPIAIAQATGVAAQEGPGPLLTLAAFLSLNLAMVNLLPFPALDGGRLAMLVVEQLRGRRLNPRIEGMVHLVGFAVLVTLMLIVTAHDVTRH